MRKRLLVVLVAVTVFAGLGLWRQRTTGTRHAPLGQRALLTVDRENLAQVRQAFNAAPEHPRVLAFLSTT